MRLLAALFALISTYNVALAFPIAYVSEISWCIAKGKNIPDNFSKIDSNTVIPFKDPYWLKVVVNSDSKSTCIIEAGSNYMQGMSYYNAQHELLFSGNFQEISLEEGTNILFIHYPFKDFKSTNHYQIAFHEKAKFYKNRFLPEITGAIFIAIILFLFFLSASFYIVSRFFDKIYWYYAWYLGSIVIFFSYQYGTLGKFLPFINQVSPSYIWISSASITISYLFFAQAFLELKRTDPKVFKLINIGKYFIVGVVFTEVVTYFFGIDVQHSIVYKTIVISFQITTMPYILYRCYLQKTTLSWIFICGALILVLTTLTGQAVSTFKAISDTNLYIQIGLLIEVFIFSIGIGMRMVLINQEKRAAQSLLINQLSVNKKIQQDFIKELEVRVDDRTKELLQSNHEKELLLKEIHHRVKNNLQTISSLLNIQQRKLSDPAAIDAIEDSKNRIQVMGLLHKFLYQHDNFKIISIKPYLEQLTEMLVESHQTNTKVIANVTVCDIRIDIETAINIGLIINELIINSLKHATPLDQKLSISLVAIKIDNLLNITLSDNGQNNISKLLQKKTGFGWKLIQALVEKSDGTLNSSYKNGFIVDISMPFTSVRAYANMT